MSNKNKPGSKSLFETRGFYVALYSCIALVLVVAVGITYQSLWNVDSSSATAKVTEPMKTAPPKQTKSSGVGAIPEAAPSSIKVEEGVVENVLPASSQNDKPVVKAEEPKQQAENTETAEEVEAPVQQALEPVNETVAASTNTQEPLGLVKNETSGETAEAPTGSTHGGLIPNDVSNYVNNNDEMLADPVFNTFTGNEDMAWPVNGEIVMVFSVDRLVYDKTLDQYRTNDSLCIGANIGEQVKSAADGVVRSITTTRENGNTIVIEHGNGWFTTYSQLQDGILVAEGDVVTEGQVIGGVGEPSIYATLLGSHLSFKVTKDDAAVDPNLVLAMNQ